MRPPAIRAILTLAELQQQPAAVFDSFCINPGFGHRPLNLQFGKAIIFADGQMVTIKDTSRGQDFESFAHGAESGLGSRVSELWRGSIP